jgi:hypothetical protein
MLRDVDAFARRGPGCAPARLCGVTLPGTSRLTAMRAGAHCPCLGGESKSFLIMGFGKRVMKLLPSDFNEEPS